jgi:hypothetical protein
MKQFPFWECHKKQNIEGRRRMGMHYDSPPVWTPDDLRRRRALASTMEPMGNRSEGGPRPLKWSSIAARPRFHATNPRPHPKPDWGLTGEGGDQGAGVGL